MILIKQLESVFIYISVEEKNKKTVGLYHTLLAQKISWKKNSNENDNKCNNPITR